MSDKHHQPEPDEAGFVTRVEREARAEADRVLADLRRLRFRADQVVHVLRALKLDVPPELRRITEGRAEPVNAPAVAPKAAPEAAREPAGGAPPSPPVARPESAPEGREEPEPGKSPEPVKSPEPEGSFPEHLRPYPPARKGGRLDQRIRVAENMHVIAEFARSVPTFVVTEVAPVVGMPAARVADYCRELERAGVAIERTGRNRRAAGQEDGRAGVEYRARREAAAEEAAAAEETAEEAALSRTEADVLARVRDAVVKQSAASTVAGIASEVGAPAPVVREALKALEGRGIVEDVGLPGSELYEYRKPTDAGAAARLDAARRAVENGGGGGSAPVAGTGKGLRISHPEVRRLVEDAQRAGGRISAAAGHYAVECPQGRVVISATPRSSRTVLNDRARLRRAGLRV